MSKIKVTFHRTYEIEESQVLERLEDSNLPEDYEFSDDEIKETAAEIAMDLMSEEMVYFTDKLEDFVSHTVELIPSTDNK
jgi:GTP-sensing pleiotropic transcriptional regulator CodY